MQQILDWLVQLTLGIRYIHEKRILHRDLKTSNVFLDALNVCKLGDFGIARVLDSTLEQAKTVVGTPYVHSLAPHSSMHRCCCRLSTLILGPEPTFVPGTT